MDKLENLKISVRVHEGGKLPESQPGNFSSAAVYASEDVLVKYGEVRRVPLALAFEIPPGVVLQLCRRFGISLMHGLTLCNTGMVIGEGYTGLLNAHMTLLRRSPGQHQIDAGDWVAQLLVLPVQPVSFIQVNY